MNNISFIEYMNNNLAKAAKVILAEKLYENKDYANYNIAKEIIAENINSGYRIIFAIISNKDVCGVAVIDDEYYKTFGIYRGTEYFTDDVSTILNHEMKTVSCFVKPKYRHKGIGSDLVGFIKNKNNVFACNGAKGSDEFWQKNNINCFTFNDYKFMGEYYYENTKN